MNAEDLDEVNRKIKLLEEADRARKWCKENPDKKKEQNAKWNAKYRNEYQKAYYAKNKKKKKP